MALPAMKLSPDDITGIVGILPTPATPDVCTVAVLVEGVEIPGEFHVLSASVTKELNRIPAATLQLRDGEAARAPGGTGSLTQRARPAPSG